MVVPFDFLGMDYDDIHRERQRLLVATFKDNDATWEKAMIAASLFSDGKPCREGKGAGGEAAPFPREPQRDGSFNICYWIKVDGIDAEWVVRFPKPFAPRQVLQTKLRSEVATLQYLSQHTRVPVPRLIGYGEGNDKLPPFLIIEHCEGWRLNIIWGAKIKNSWAEDTIMQSLAEIQHELLLHPFNRIGMLDVSAGLNAEQEMVGPVSLDALEHCRDGVTPYTPAPIHTASNYYEFKLEVATHRLRTQRNSIDSISDGRRKFLNPHIIREYLRANGRLKDDGSPFYLAHPDLHGANVIIDLATFRIVSILDWEGACILPCNDACALPRCLDNTLLDDLVPRSESWRIYNDRAKRYSKLFAKVARAHHTDFAVANTITTDLFFTWAINDVRTLDSLTWQHLAPSLYPDLRKEYDRLCCRDDHPGCPADTDAIASVVNKFVEMRCLEGSLGPALDEEVDKKMLHLQEYKKELASKKPNS
jgi:hypothetical protein